MDESKIKSAFTKVKQDLFSIQSQLELIKHEIKELKDLKRTSNTSTLRQINPTDRQHTSDTSTDKHPSQAFYPLNTHISTGNEGVSTDRQTDRQTDNTHPKFAQSEEISFKESPQNIKEFTPNNKENTENPEEMSKVLNSLNTLRSSLSKSFKSLTNQEYLILSTLYIQQEKGNTVTYQSIASKLLLTESSIRDYIQRIIKKGIPVDKTKENNKKVFLSLPSNFRKLASLDTITEIREASKSRGIPYKKGEHDL
jgi:DNA-binding MarR family transcriptional regulator